MNVEKEIDFMVNFLSEHLDTLTAEEQNGIIAVVEKLKEGRTTELADTDGLGEDA